MVWKFPINVNLVNLKLEPCKWEFLKRFWDKKFRYKEYKFIYKKFFKKLAIYKNGHGIMINILEIDPIESLNSIRRFFDAKMGCGCKEVSLPSLNKMLQTEKEHRFNKAGFWFQCFDCEIRISEDYKDRKEFFFEWRIPQENLIRLSYAYSIPCLYPIEDGFFLSEKAECDKPEVRFSVNNPIKEFEYELAFCEIKPKVNPQMEILKGDTSSGKKYDPEVLIDPFYIRYRFSLKNLDPGSIITIYWEWNKKKGGD